MTVETAENIYGLPQFYASLIGTEFIKPACIINGLQGIVAVTQAIGSPGVWYVNVNFPKYVEVPTYPSFCGSSETSLVDVSWMKDNAPLWVTHTLAPLLAAAPEGDVYSSTLAYITGIMGGIPPYNFVYGTPSYILY
jgi:hypothetical protein